MNCIMCGNEVHADVGYVTDGKVYICDDCAESNSLPLIMTRIHNSGVESNLVSVWTPAVEANASVS